MAKLLGDGSSKRFTDFREVVLKVRRFLDLWGSEFLPKGFQHQQMADCRPVLAENPFFHGVHCNLRKHTSSLLPDVPLSP